jgi:hypothetical protein
MSRSLHTAPRPVRAARRAAAPFAPRRAGPGDPGGGRSFHPQIRAARSRPGTVRPLGPADVRAVLARLGPAASYGLRAVELAAQGEPLVFGRLLVPGRILLFDQPRPPWRVPGRLGGRTVERLEAAGALVEPSMGADVVDWPGGTLRAFYLAEVLLHELGHHRVQHEAGKRGARTRRRADHERAAAVHAARWLAELTA